MASKVYRYQSDYTDGVLGQNEKAYIVKGASIANLGGSGLTSTNSNVTALIQGDLVGGLHGISFTGDSFNTSSGQRVVVYESGSVAGLGAGCSGIFIDGQGSSVINHGYIFGANGIYFDTALSVAPSYIRNSGTIDGSNYGIVAEGDLLLKVINRGVIDGGDRSFWEIAGNAVQRIINKGEMSGDILLGGGADLYDGRKGSVDGGISGGAGNDRIYGGAEDNIISGDAGNDRLTGGGGHDVFVFYNSEATDADSDVITDFKHADDDFQLQFGSVPHSGMLKASEFVVIDDLTSGQGITKNTIIMYDKNNGDIYMDLDGSRPFYSRVLLAHIDPKSALDYTDFYLAVAPPD